MSKPRHVTPQEHNAALVRMREVKRQERNLDARRRRCTVSHEDYRAELARLKAEYSAAEAVWILPVKGD